jgi:hypothetical protein
MFAFHKILFDKGKEKNFLGLNIGHTAEWLLLVYAVSIITDWLWLKAALWGMLFHMLVDLIFLYQQKRFTHRALSVIEYIIRWDGMKRRGLHPELPYVSTLQSMSGFSEGKTRKTEHDN